MKRVIKTISVILTVIMFFSVFSASTTVFAEQYNTYVDGKAYEEKLLTETFGKENEKAEIVCEVPEKREEFSKTYKRADGSYTKVFSQVPLHTYENGEWKVVDNSLQSNGTSIENADGKFEVSFPETLSESNKIEIENQGENISFSLNNIEDSAAQITSQAATADVVKQDLSKTYSEIIYENIDTNTDVQYIISSNSVKENIIISEKASLKDTYSFDIEKGDLIATLGEDKSVAFKNPQNETVFTIPAPVMTDAENNISYNIDVAITNADKTVLTLTYTPSKEWLDNAQYPVVIDPVIEIPSGDETIIEDTVVGFDSNIPELRNVNFKNFSDGVAVNTGSLSDGDLLHTDILVNINISAFSCFKNSSLEITDVNYYSRGRVECGNVLVKEINGTWDADTVTYDDVYPADGSTPQITYGTEIIDFASGGADMEYSLIYFNITDIFKASVKNNTNADFAIVAGDSEVRGDFTSGGTETDRVFNSYISIDYVDTSCANDAFEYITQSIGRAGTVYVNTFSRSLSLTRSDISADGLRMPVSVDFAYNPALINFTKNHVTAEGINQPTSYGNNWLPLNIQAMFNVTGDQWQVFTGEGTLVTFNKKEESVTETVDGEETTKTVITFEEDETSDSGYALELINQTSGISSENMKLISPTGEVSYFNEDGFVVEICEAEANADGTYDKNTIVYSEVNPFIIDYITDGIGRKYDFVYNTATGLISEIKCFTADGIPIKAGTTNVDLKVSYSYDENRNLTGVTYPDGESVAYTYDSAGNLIKVQNIDAYNILYTYDEYGKVTNIAEYADTTPGNTITLTQLSNRQVKVADAFSGTQTYQFGKDGLLHYIFDEKGNYCKSDYAPVGDENVYESYNWSISSENLLKNSSFEDVSVLSSTRAKYWSNAFARVADETAPKGEYAYCILSESDVTEFVEQTIDVLNPCSYTLSAYVKSQATGELTLKITAADVNSSTESAFVKINSAEDWERFSVTYTPDDIVPVKITASIGFENSCGTYYVDNVQLETGKGTAEYNLVENGSFNSLSDGSPNMWSEATVVDENIYGKKVKAVKLGGGLPSYTQSGETYTLSDTVSAVTQNVKINGKKDDVYSVGGWLKGLFDDNYINSNISSAFSEYAPLPTSSSAQLKVTYLYTDTVTTTDETTNETTTAEQTLTENFTVDFAPHNEGWQYAVDSFALKGDVESVDVTVITKNIPSDTFATGIELTKNDSAIYFEDTEETESTDTADDTATGTDTETATETEPECPCKDCEEYDCTCVCESEELCTCIQCKRSSNIEVVSDDERTVTTKSYDGVNYMQSSVGYSEDYNYINSETDTNGISTSYTYNESNGTLTAVTDGVGNVTSYATNPMGYLTLAETNVTGLTDNAVKMAISYVYDGDLLDKITQGNVEYDYVYDEWGQLKSVLIDNIRLIQYTYGEDEYRTRITKIVFGSSSENGFTIEYSYDSATGEIISVEKYNYIEDEKNSIIYNYIYDNLGTLTTIKDNGTGHEISYTDTGVVIKDGKTGDTIYELKDVTPVVDDTEENADSTENTNTTETDENKPISITQETANGVKYNHNVYDSDYDALTGKTTENEFVGVVTATDENGVYSYGKAVGTQGISDWFGRNETVTVMTKNPIEDTVTDYASVSSQYGYVTENNVTTNLISSVNNTITGSEGNKTVNYTYTYNDNGKITGVTAVSNITGLSSASQYIYDEAGQLVKEIKGTDYTEYAYDSKGNISTRKVYSNNTLVSTDNYTYGSETWEDKLTGYNNKTITYDSIGNPTSYLGATLTWRGRELESYTNGNIQISYSYDVDGMRYQKVVKTNGVETSRYDYVYSEGTLVLVTFTADGVSDTARFIYDSYGEPRGFILNDTAAFLYIKNAQGDITGIVDENGEVILTCSYDAWGRVNFGSTNMTHMTLAAKLSQINPFTYRGYCYDYDIGMYYLQSRYYDPEICRFINADDTNYLNATGTVLSCNLFAYCENDGVNFVDETGCAKAKTKPKTLQKYLKETYDEILTTYGNSKLKLKIKDNKITITASFYFTGGLDMQRISTAPRRSLLYKEAFMRGIMTYWSGDFKVFGYKVELKTIVKEKRNGIKVFMYNSSGISKVNLPMNGWKRNKVGTVIMYKGDCREYPSYYDHTDFKWVSAHEFGHLLGVADAYNQKPDVVSIFNVFKTKVKNVDLKKVILAFVENAFQGWI